MKTKLVRNEAASAPKVRSNLIQNLTFNLVPAKSRIEFLEQREHIVVPVVMLGEGVHRGSDGALWYSRNELGKTPSSWDHKPIIVYHPADGVSGCNPDVINNRKIGVIMNTTFEEKTNRLKAEAWIEKSRADAIDPRVSEAINNNQVMEVSTGLFLDIEDTAGTWNEEKYVGIALNFRPDHLAILPDKKGAFSVEDGGGLCRNQASDRPQTITRMDKILNVITRRLGITDNELSFSDIEKAIYTELHKKLSVNTDKGPWPWVVDVFSNFFVYNMDGTLFRLSYDTSSKGEVSLGSESPVKVRRETVYRTVEGAVKSNQDQTQNENMDKAKMIVAILAANCAFKDKAALEALSDDQIAVIHNGLKPPGSTTTPPAAPAAPATNAQQPPAVPATTTTNANVIPLTAEQYIATAPREFQEVLTNSMEVYNSQKASFIEVITKNASNPYTKEELSAKPLGELRKLASLAGVAQQPATAPAIYAGAGIPAGVTGNEEEPLALPNATDWVTAPK